MWPHGPYFCFIGPVHGLIFWNFTFYVPIRRSPWRISVSKSDEAIVELEKAIYKSALWLLPFPPMLVNWSTPMEDPSEFSLTYWFFFGGCPFAGSGHI